MSLEFIQITDEHGKAYVRHSEIEAVLPSVDGSPTRIYVATGGWFGANESPEEIITKLRDINALREAEERE